MQKLLKVFERETEKLLTEIKSKSKTYGEAKKLIQEMAWDRSSPLKSFVISEVERKLQAEMNKIPIQKERGQE